MPLRLNELTSDDEFPGLMATLYNSYSKPYNGFWDIFKGESEEECQARYMQWHKADPTSHWIYVTDTETGQVIGGSQWNIFEKNPYLETNPPMAAYWIQEGNAENSVSLLRAVHAKTLLKRHGIQIYRGLGVEQLLSWSSSQNEPTTYA